MIEFDDNLAKYKLALANEICIRLRLIGDKGEPLSLAHEHKETLEALQLEIMDRYRVREISYLRQRQKWTAKIIGLLDKRKMRQEDDALRKWVLSHCQ